MISTEMFAIVHVAMNVLRLFYTVEFHRIECRSNVNNTPVVYCSNDVRSSENSRAVLLWRQLKGSRCRRFDEQKRRPIKVKESTMFSNFCTSPTTESDCSYDGHIIHLSLYLQQQKVCFIISIMKNTIK
jgi:hypothetical protein